MMSSFFWKAGRPCPAVLLLVLAFACRQAPHPDNTFAAHSEQLSTAVDKVTEVMLGSVTSPPVASRTYAYASIAAYEALRHDYPEFRSLAGQLNGLETPPAPASDEVYLLPLASVVAFLSVAQALVFAPDEIAEYREQAISEMLKQGVPRPVVERSVVYANAVAQHVLAWAATDNLKRARALPRFEVVREPGRWQPTPPAYMEAVEPNWQILRPFVMDSASQFRPPPPVVFDTVEGSAFRQQVMAVYRTVLGLTPEQREIATFWDNNVFAVNAVGHMMFAVKKISPGGHWMGITGIALQKSGANMMQAAEAYARVALSLADGFISVWEEKYRSVVVRPETVIADLIDPDWRPLLQTPPFPEYPSGHSVISAAAAEVLSGLFGERFAFADDIEVPFGMPVRAFPSFRVAAEEAAISRLYGGIHYPMAIEHGVAQGRALGNWLSSKVMTREAERIADSRQR